MRRRTRQRKPQTAAGRPLMSRLPVVSFSGLNADSLGTYLASLGLCSLAARRWPGVRACWQNARFCLVGGPTALEQVVDFVGEVGATNEWTEYRKPWDQHKKADVKAKTAMRTARWRSLEADETLLLLFGAHLALDGRVRMNPLLGTGGNAGQRDFAKGWKASVQTIRKPPHPQNRDTLKVDLGAFLEGAPCRYAGSKFNAGSWFGTDNKTYNHGTKRPFREGTVTPWAMTLACEGLTFFAGGPSRQLGSRRQPKGAFPFVTTAMAPNNVGEAGGVEAEIWAPVWTRPMTKPELSSLFIRGRSEVGGKAATTSAAFSVSILGRGVDAGVAEFRRFLLLHTTSSQTFESRLVNVVPMPKKAEDRATIQATQRVIALRDTLPQDRKIGQRWRFVGLRGPLEQALVRLSTSEPNAGRAERGWMLADELFDALVKVDRNRTLRGRDVRFRLLPGEWATRLFREDPPDREARLALALASLAATPTAPPLIAYRIGVREAGRAWEFPEAVPARRVWTGAALAENLCAMGERRVFDATQSRATAPPPFGATFPADLDDVHAWLSGDVDEGQILQWVNRLCLFDWNWRENRASSEALRGNRGMRDDPTVDGMLALYGLFRPLVSDSLFRRALGNSGVGAKEGASCMHLTRTIALLRRGDLSAAADAARAVYHSASVALADFDLIATGVDTERLLASLFIPCRSRAIVSVFRRWRAPTQPTGPT